MIIEPSWKSGYPELVMTDESTKLEAGHPISLCLSENRHCIGYREFGATSQTACLRDRLMSAGKETQCEDCRVKDVSFVAKTGIGDSRQATELLNRDHAVYLALFSKDIIKVGVSVWERRAIRTKEQGATACLFIARGNGTVARNLERRIHNNLGFTEWVRASTKLSAMAQIADESDAQAILNHEFDRIKSRFDEASLIEPEFMYHRPSYGLSEESISLPICQITSINPRAVIGGNISGILGKLLLIDYRQKLYALDMNLLSGYSLQKPLTQEFVGEIDGLQTKSIEVDRQQSLLGLL